MRIRGRDGNELRSLQTKERLYYGPAAFCRVLVGQHENLVMLTFGNGHGQLFLNVLRYNHSLFHTNCYGYVYFGCKDTIKREKMQMFFAIFRAEVFSTQLKIWQTVQKNENLLF
jgi:hypothetical protein